MNNHFLVEKIRNYPDGMAVQVLYLDLIDYHKISTSQGHSLAMQMLERVHHHLVKLAEKVPLSIVVPLWDDAFIVVAPAETDLLAWINGLRYYPSFHIGVSFFEYSAQQANELPDVIYRALTHAAFVSKTSDGIIDSHLAQELHRIINDGLITPFYQPIYSLCDFNVLGYEALSRGPEESTLRMPDVLFNVGKRYGRLFELEHLCRKAAISDAPIRNQQLLFVNINPQTLNDPIYVKGRTKEWAKANGINSTQIVFEITEHEAISDYGTFRKSIDHYRDQGYLIAIDDTGSGYSGLLTLVELTPDFIKLDRGLISQIDSSSHKQAMVEAMVVVANKIGAKTIAEGIETKAELNVVKELGVDCGQGFLLGRPMPSIKYREMMADW